LLVGAAAASVFPGATANFPILDGATREMVALGDRIFHGQVGGATCMTCHGASGKGSTLGPDLTTNKWLWSDGSFKGIAKTISDGVMQPKDYRSPMPPQGGAQLTDSQVLAVAAYVWSLSQMNRSPAPSAALRRELSIHGFVVTPGAATAEVWIQPDKETSLGVFSVLTDDTGKNLWACLAPVPGRGGHARSCESSSGLSSYFPCNS
jgi:mono/diheme cytochrome c family protein